MRRSASSAIVSAVFFATCAAPPSDAPDASDAGLPPDAGAPSTGPVEATRYCEEIAPFFCRFYLRCNRIAATDQASCESMFAESCEGKYERRYAALAAANLLELRREGLRACETHLDAVACDDQVFDLDGPCAGVWRGKQAEGNACGFDLETFTCAPGTRCILNLSLCGTCERIVGAGEDCSATGVTCAADASCVEGKCVVRKGPGETCEGFSDCRPGLSCDEDSGRCTAPERMSVGESCGQGKRCPFGATCVSGTCRAQARDGQACDAAIGCVGGRCVEGACVDLLQGNASCTSSASCESGICREGRCEPVPGRCFVAE